VNIRRRGPVPGSSNNGTASGDGKLKTAGSPLLAGVAERGGGLGGGGLGGGGLGGLLGGAPHGPSRAACAAR
jgi:hypothetical protein